jgi:hypothetical protein
VEELCAAATAEVGEDKAIKIANYLCPGNYAVSGSVEGCEAVEKLAKSFKARMTVRLSVAGAFHTKYMAPAAEKLQVRCVCVGGGGGRRALAWGGRPGRCRGCRGACWQAGGGHKAGCKGAQRRSRPPVSGAGTTAPLALLGWQREPVTALCKVHSPRVDG